MFTGIVGEVGTVERLDAAAGVSALTIGASGTCDGLHVGDSIAVNGVCLTAVEVEPGSFQVQVVAETLDRSNLGGLQRGARVNLERALAGSGRFDGHIVQGHVDGTGTVVSITQEGESQRMRVSVTPDIVRYIVEKGSITVDGVSLTVTAVSPAGGADHWFEIVLIPHTIEVTVLGARRIADTVNLETDILAKYIERMMETIR